jgi:sarcosine oxidase
MTIRRYDVVVAGLGAMGSAIAFHLAQRNVRVIGLDRFVPPHDRGSSHGESRIIRQAYFEHPSYVPLVLRSYDLWRELESLTAQPLLRVTGGAMLGPAEGALVQGALQSARQHRLAHELLSAADVRARFPAFHPSDDMVGVYEPHAGVLFPEACVAAHLAAARRYGATVQYEEPLIGWKMQKDGIEIRTTKETYHAAQLVLSIGPWLPQLLPALPFEIERQVLFWFRPKERMHDFTPERCPIYIWESLSQQFFYGFPDLGGGVKIGRHHRGERTTADTVRRHVDMDDETALRDLVSQYMPDANGEIIRSVVCLYTNTPDTHFVLDRHPEYANIWLASPCSGHGFKFASVIGEIVADLLTQGETAHDIHLFRLQRLSQ